jgi:iron complex transport system substrate-binding protein
MGFDRWSARLSLDLCPVFFYGVRTLSYTDPMAMAQMPRTAVGTGRGTDFLGLVRCTCPCARTVVLAVGCALLAAACQSHVPKPRGESSSEDPKRLVVLTPSLVEIAFSLGLGPRIVGVTKFATFPPETANIQKVGDFLQPNVELVATLRPDLVLLDAVQVNAQASLKGVGISTLAVAVESVEDVRAAVQTVGAATGRQAAAAQLIDQIDADLKAASRRHAGKARPRVLFAVDREVGSLRNLVCAGPGTYIDDLIRRAGGDNVLADGRLRFFRVAPEEIVARKPTVILDAMHTSNASRAREDWFALGTVPAVQTGRVYVLDDPAFVTPGPRLGQMLRKLSELLHAPPAAASQPRQ